MTTAQTIESLVDSFLDDCKARGLSIRTVEAYAYPLSRQFVPFCAREGITSTAQLTPALEGKFTAHLLEDGGKHGQLSRASVRSYVRSARIFLTWAGGEGGATVGALPKLPRPHRRDVDVLSRSEIARMEGIAKTERDKLLVRVLADTGVRLGELLQLTAGDVREGRRGEYLLAVHGKGARDRSVPVAPALYRRLRAYLNGRGAEASSPVFVALRKDELGLYRLITKSGAEQAIRLLGREAGIEKRVYPHLLRHSFATEWLRKGANIISLQRVLGHSDLSQIQAVYSHLITADDYAAMLTVLSGKD